MVEGDAGARSLARNIYRFLKRQLEQRPESVQVRLLFNEKITLRNTGKGGIWPPEALNSHQLNLAKLIETSLPFLPGSDQSLPVQKRLWLRDGQIKEKPDFVSVTRGPGMNQNLAVGLNTAKGLATAWQVPLLGVHHMQAHALTPRLATAIKGAGQDSSQPEFPFLTLLVSGGHTMLLHSKSLLEHEILASTSDTAIGDELDKCGRMLLPAEIQHNTPDTSFGKYLSAYAFKSSAEFNSWSVPQNRQDEIIRPQNSFGWSIMTPMAKNRELCFSFSGISSQIKRIVSDRHCDTSDEERTLLARAALGTAFEHLGSRTIIALEQLRDQGLHIPTLVVSGGVAANDFLRYYLRQMLDVRSFHKVNLVFPPVELCTDNAAMIAWTGVEMFEAGYRTDLGCGPLRKWSMDGQSEDGGILGAGAWILQNPRHV
ncbi:Mitochondrial tRNAs modification protein [Knufia peltigerae]|uniref:N(6)-L-threonylcarbamoyladenine synthase n=1 Tax=Knufia peltigerae TaxID=1002370 RepID=A0AA39CXA2_9EURO|nr:Mitochondrial tRNAs modification protein [Knufia peltigerae]